MTFLQYNYLHDISNISEISSWKLHVFFLALYIFWSLFVKTDGNYQISHVGGGEKKIHQQKNFMPRMQSYHHSCQQPESKTSDLPILKVRGNFSAQYKKSLLKLPIVHQQLKLALNEATVPGQYLQFLLKYIYQ